MTDKMLEEFNRWISLVREKYGYADNAEAILLMSHIEQSLWSAWQASRAALVVELPTDFPVTPLPRHMSIRSEAIKECREALTKAGVTVK